MRRLLCVLAALAAVESSGRGPDSTTPVLGIRPEPVSLRAFRNARIVVSPDSTIDGATLIIRDGRVEAVGRDVGVPAGAEEIDVHGNTIYPGFVDPYTAYGLKDVTVAVAVPAGPRQRSAQFEGQRVGPDAWNDAIHAERSWVESFEPDADAAAKLLERGVTTVQSVRQDGILRGRGFVVSLGEGLPNDLVLVARGPLFASFDKGTSRQAYPSSLMGSIALLRQTFLDARWYAEAQAAWNRDPAQTRPEVNVALAALGGEIGPIVFETEDELSLLRAQRLATEFELPLIHGREQRRIPANRRGRRARPADPAARRLARAARGRNPRGRDRGAARRPAPLGARPGQPGGARVPRRALRLHGARPRRRRRLPGQRPSRDPTRSDPAHGARGLDHGPGGAVRHREAGRHARARTARGFLRGRRRRPDRRGACPRRVDRGPAGQGVRRARPAGLPRRARRDARRPPPVDRSAGQEDRRSVGEDPRG